MKKLSLIIIVLLIGSSLSNLFGQSDCHKDLDSAYKNYDRELATFESEYEAHIAKLKLDYEKKYAETSNSPVGRDISEDLKAVSKEFNTAGQKYQLQYKKRVQQLDKTYNERIATIRKRCPKASVKKDLDAASSVKAGTTVIGTRGKAIPKKDTRVKQSKTDKKKTVETGRVGSKSTDSRTTRIENGKVSKTKRTPSTTESNEADVKQDKEASRTNTKSTTLRGGSRSSDSGSILTDDSKTKSSDSKTRKPSGSNANTDQSRDSGNSGTSRTSGTEVVKLEEVGRNAKDNKQSGKVDKSTNAGKTSSGNSTRSSEQAPAPTQERKSFWDILAEIFGLK